MRSAARVVSAVGLAVRLMSLVWILIVEGLAVTLAGVAGQMTVHVPGSSVPLLVHVAVGPLIAIVCASVLNEEWHSYERVGSRPVWLSRLIREVASSVALSLGLAFVWVVAESEVVVALSMLIWAIGVTAMSFVPRLWWIIPLCATYIVMITGWVVLWGIDARLWTAIAAFVAVGAGSYVTLGSADARWDRRAVS